jgi:hypothetical protein
MEHAIFLLALLFIYQATFYFRMRTRLIRRLKDATLEELITEVRKCGTCISLGLFIQFLALAILASSLVIYMKYLKTYLK